MPTAARPMPTVARPIAAPYVTALATCHGGSANGVTPLALFVFSALTVASRPTVDAAFEIVAFLRRAVRRRGRPRGLALAGSGPPRRPTAGPGARDGGAAPTPPGPGR